jgi:hypothetical protein
LVSHESKERLQQGRNFSQGRVPVKAEARDIRPDDGRVQMMLGLVDCRNGINERDARSEQIGNDAHTRHVCGKRFPAA